MIRRLQSCQTIDPARGSFIVQPAPKRSHGRLVKWRGRVVYDDKPQRDAQRGIEFVLEGA